MNDNGKHILNQGEDPEKDGILSRMTKKQPFDIPEGYFEQLPLKIQERINPEESTFWVHVLGFILKPQIAIPVLATLILMVAGLTYYTRFTKDDSREIAVVRSENSEVGDLEEEKILAPIGSIKKEEVKVKHTEQLEEDMIIEEMDEITSEEEEIILQQEKIAAVSSEEIDYLLENDIDVSLIVDEL